MKLFRDEKGKTHETVYLDGYDIADRLLEGVMIQIQVDNDGTIKAAFCDRDEDYVSDFNTAKFLKQATDYVQGMIDEGDFTGLCPTASATASYDMIVELIDA